MPTVYIRTNLQPSTVGTTRILTVSTGAATQVVSLSGYMGMQVTCLGPGEIAYGDTAILADTSALLFYSMSKEYYPIADTLSLYLRANSVATVVALNDYL